jgi:hypothetical protein
MTNEELTILANTASLSQKEFNILSTNRHKIKTYHIDMYDSVLILRATDDLNLLKYLKKHFETEEISSIQEVITTFREVDYSF